MEGAGMWVVIRFGISPRCTNSLPWFYFWSDWRRRQRVWAMLRYLSGCVYRCPKVYCRVRELVGGKSPATWGAEVRVWATFKIRFNGGIFRDIHTHFFYDIPILANMEIQVNGYLLRKSLLILPAMMKVPPWIITLDEPLNIDIDIDAQQNKDLGRKNRARPVQGSE